MQQEHANTSLATHAAHAVEAAGGDWGRLLDESSELVIFGSVPAGVAGPHSDLDLLVVGSASGRKTQELDLVVHREEQIWTPAWLRSELAGHIASYGIWLKGRPAWAGEVRVRDEAAAKKWARIERMARAALRHWERLDARFRAETLVSVRRELQRALLLEAGVAIPPTAMLDAQCAGIHGDNAWIDALAAPDEAELVRAAPRVLSELARTLPGTRVASAG